MAARRVVVVGDVMTDVVVQLSANVVRDSNTPARITFAPGGSAANQAVWLARAGVETHLVTVVGANDHGRSSLDAAQTAGVQVHATTVPDRQSGVVVSLVDFEGRRSMLSDRGANVELGLADPPASLFRAGDHLHLSGYELLDEHSRDAALALSQRAAEAGMTRSVDPCSAVPFERVGPETFLEWTAGFEVCCANFDEGRLLAGLDNPISITRSLTRHYPTVALTLGGRGALAMTNDGIFVEAPPPTTEVVDTTGARDAFIGSFLAAWVRGEHLEVAVARGLDAAFQAVAAGGAR